MRKLEVKIHKNKRINYLTLFLFLYLFLSIISRAVLSYSPIFLIGSSTLSAQTPANTATLKGFILNSSNKPIEFASIGVINLAKPIGGVSKSNGEFSITVPANIYLTLRISHASYDVKSINITLKPNEIKSLNIILKEKNILIDEVRIEVDRNRGNYIKLNPLTSMNLPSITGGIESMLMALPGVSNANELSSQYTVRGGNFDENLVYVNDIEVYRPLLTRAGEQEGLSFINPSLVESIVFSSGGFDAKYGDKISSVLDVKYRRPTEFAGSFGLNFMGGNIHFEGTDKSKKFTYLAGLRHKATQYVLKSLDKKGNYKPSFTDFQTLLTYEINKKNEISLLGNISYNIYKVIPTSQSTTFGAYGQPSKGFFVLFEGQEITKYATYFGALTWKHNTNENFTNKLTFSFFNTIESENYDIEGSYLLGNVLDPNKPTIENMDILGVGNYLDHARNDLNAIVSSLDYKGSLITDKVYFQWGVKYQYEDVIDRINEWRLEDSAGYAIPDIWDNGIGDTNTLNAVPPILQDVYKTSNHTRSHRVNGFIQASTDFNTNDFITLNAGLRASYWSFNNEFIVSPRFNLIIAPDFKLNTVFRFSLGHYAQPPFYKEVRDIYGNLHKDVKAQKSIHVVFGTDLTFNMWSRPFKFTAEAYYKYLYDINPYEVDNIRVRYMAKNCGKGYAAGLDLRLNGEFVKGVESWISVSLMKTSENISYTNALTGEKQTTGWLPRPSDQIFSINILFQDYITRNNRLKVYVNMVYSTGIPVYSDRLNTIEAVRNGENISLQPERRMDYKRIDIGMAYLLKKDGGKKYGPKNPLNYIKNVWLGLEVFNLTQMRNVISYTWVKATDGTQYAIPNKLTPLQVNLKLNIDF